VAAVSGAHSNLERGSGRDEWDEVEEHSIMSKNLCQIWSALADHPRDPKTIAEAHAHLMQLLEHADDCEECRAVSASMQDETGEAVFAALSQGGVSLEKDELAILKTMDQLLADDRKAIDAGVEFLLAGLPAPLSTLDQIAGGAALTPLQVFLGIDAVNMLTRSHASRSSGRSVRLSNAGLRVENNLVARRAAIVGEIGRHAGVTPPAAEGLWTWQLGVAALCPTLYRGLEVSNIVNGELEVKLQKSASSADLIERWTIQPKETLSPLQAREVVREIIRIVRVWSNSIEPLLGSVVQEIGMSGDQTLKKVVEQITIENREIEELIKPLKVGPITSDDNPWPQIRAGDRITLARAAKFAERRKRFYLREISAANLDGAATGLNIEPLRKYAARSVRFDRNIRALDRYESALSQGQTATGLVKGTAAE
jgi:hypothetical protein